jgi:hypothetical protein
MQQNEIAMFHFTFASQEWRTFTRQASVARILANYMFGETVQPEISNIGSFNLAREQQGAKQAATLLGGDFFSSAKSSLFLIKDQ